MVMIGDILSVGGGHVDIPVNECFEHWVETGMEKTSESTHVRSADESVEMVLSVCVYVVHQTI